MPAKMRSRSVSTAQRVQQRRVTDDLKLPGLAEALEVYRRIVAPGSVQERSAPVQGQDRPGRSA
jgi:hypothetical protein